VSGTRARGSRTVVGFSAAIGLIAALAMPALGASVDPELIDQTANLECDAFEADGQSWATLKVDPNPDGAGPFHYSDGTLSVTITNAEGDKSFDWSSNIGVDAVYVKAGAGGSNLYRYDPPSEVTSDADLVSPGVSGNGISHISFCYDDENPTPTPTPTEEETASPSPTPTPSESQGGEEETSSPTPTGSAEGELGGNPTPTPGALPDTAAGDLTGMPAMLLTLVMLTALAATVYTRLARQR
jgi:hypothetical protein